MSASLVKNDDLEAVHNIIGDEITFKDLDFTEKSIRLGFIRKVYGLLMVQLAMTLAFVSVFVFVDPVKEFIYQQPEPFILAAFAVLIVTIITMLCSKNVRRKAPGNFIFLGLFTVAMSFIVGVVCSVSQKDEVFMALGITTVLCLGLTLFAFQTKIDFTLLHTGLFSFLLVLSILGVSVFYFEPTRLTHLCFAAFGALLFSLLLVYDTQLIIGGKHSLAISPEEYVFAALMLYLDVINIFLRILRILRIA